jgi:subtilase family serine protease
VSSSSARRPKWLSALALAVGLSWLHPILAQTGAAPALINQAIDNSRRVRLPGNTRPEANAVNDRGRAPDTLAMQHMQLLLKRPPASEAALQQYIRELHDRLSPNYHRWLSPTQFAQRFGLAPQDLTAITGWLTQQGFTVNTVYPSLIDFSGTARQVLEAFGSEIHFVDSGGVRHLANVSDPEVPAALVPAVAGIVSLHDFRPHPTRRPRAQYTVSASQTLLSPADLATIYNLNPAFAQGFSGQNQTIVVIEDTDVFSTSDWTTFRNTFGLSAAYPAGSFNQVHPAPPSGHNNCTDPHVAGGGVDGEAALDAEWASAAAPSAAIVLASCADTRTTFGGLIALQNLINTTPPAVVSISYSECEAFNGAAANAAYIATYQQAVAEGVSVFVSTGDEGAASCDANAGFASHGIGVSGFASTPYNVAVGGTDFADTYTGTTGTYWSANNSSTFESALSYIPEIPWSDSCANTLLASFEGFGVTYGTTGFCNSSVGSGFLDTTAGSGGPSGCASGTPATSGVVGGSCSGTARPSWQTGVPGIPNTGVRVLPDVSLFAGNGLWGHYYVFCWSHTPLSGAASCTGPPSGWSGAGGTSFSAPILAGIQALVNQANGGPQGNPNSVYYALASSQHASGLGCNSSSGNGVSSGCVFYDVTFGDMDINCQGSHSCYDPSGSQGVLSTSTSSYAPAYTAVPGWDFATGLGTLNASNLVSFWSSSDLSVQASGSVSSSGLATYSLSLGNGGPQSATGVVLTTLLPPGVNLDAADGSPGCTQAGQTVTCTVGSLAVGGNAALTVVVQPGSAQTVNLTFNVTSSHGDLNVNNDSATVSLDVQISEADAPVPLWAYVTLGLLLLVLATTPSAAHKTPLRSE